MRIKIYLVCTLIALGSWSSDAAIPETGVYYNPEDPGRGYFFEVQNRIIAMAAYAYEDNGQPTFYTGAATLDENFGPGNAVEEPLFSNAGFYPWHSAIIQLFRSTGGVCFPCRDAGQVNVTTYAGSVYLQSSEQNTIIMEVLWADGRTDQFRILQRFYFSSTPTVGTTDPDLPPVLADIRGDWIFVDTQDVSASPMRFNFTRVVGGGISPTAPRPWTISYFDDSRQAEFRCRGNVGPGLIPSNPWSGCELHANGEILLWARMEDVTHTRILAGEGPILSQLEGFRGPGRIIGFRVE